MRKMRRATLLNALYGRVVYPLAEPKAYRGMQGLVADHRRRESQSLDENAGQQWSALRQVIQSAYDSVPFYRRRLDEAGVRPGDIQSPAHLQGIPLLTRDDIRNHLDDLWSRRYRREDLLPAATGGTTDVPVPLLRSVPALRKKAAVHMRFNNWAGMFPGDKVLYLWGAAVDFAKNPSWRWRAYDRFVMRRMWAPTSLFNEQVLSSYREQLNRFRPRVIYAYPTPLALLCEFLRDTGKPFHRPASVICTAEPLSTDQRRLIEQTLGCPAFEMYGSREFGMIAADCEHGNLHLNPAAAYVEFVPVPGAEVDGLCELVVTDLLNDGMPLIRYRINDCAIPAEPGCACGRGYAMLGKVSGRTADNFVLPDGNIVPGISLQNRVIKVCPGIKKIQIVQETPAQFMIRYVPGATFAAEDLKSLDSKLSEYFGQSVRWKFEPVADIQREASGKTRFCISHVSRPLAASVSSQSAAQ